MSKYKLPAFFLLIGLLACFPLFIHLTNKPIRVFDEARLAVNACEMDSSGNMIVTYYAGTPDMWNTKPPLMVWLQLIDIKVFGINELAIRLPAALAAFFTCLVIFIFCFRFLKAPGMGLTAVLILVTSGGYVMEHVARTGDYDSLLVLLTTTCLLCFFVLPKRMKRPATNSSYCF